VVAEESLKIRWSRRQLACQELMLRGLACELPDDVWVGLVVLQSLGVDRLAMLPPQELVGKAENLKTVAIADEPKIQLVPFAVGGTGPDKARHTRLLFDGSIDARCPAA
jgi:hypothetical protein